ncbi:molybdenum cofactor biosynthesis protein MoaE [Pleionea litopenaei]|uniref:Molybdopterin synthase catalytic subunit n=1 Tax=Pleionea litopenaei TaxID=3070815 RepID=A0AA51RQG1_9GAMM|nr:molybdenum cofactor biosynthesis protein MoaE [Pleionea sp. HL-JVS1]WMS85652.1 molybdenum cofactor biosynthesis protein MoaE [Pleionea sp. HL-JVS1]
MNNKKEEHNSILISELPLDTQAIMGFGHDPHLSHGAEVWFVGRVRPNSDSEKVNQLYLEHYPGMTETSIHQHIENARLRWCIEGCKVVHRVGVILPGEAIVVVGVSSLHRKESFQAADYLMDHLKSCTPFWKKEITESGESWIEVKESDRQSLLSWN